MNVARRLVDRVLVASWRRPVMLLVALTVGALVVFTPGGWWRLLAVPVVLWFAWVAVAD